MTDPSPQHFFKRASDRWYRRAWHWTTNVFTPAVILGSCIAAVKLVNVHAHWMNELTEIRSYQQEEIKVWHPLITEVVKNQAILARSAEDTNRNMDRIWKLLERKFGK